MNDLAMDIGEAVVAALVAVGQPLVVNPHGVHDRGVDVVNMHRVFIDIVGEVVGFAVFEPGFDAAAGEPHGEAAGVVVAPVLCGRERAL